MRNELGEDRRTLDPRRGPSFVFAGTARAGSNWAFEVLREHPGVFMPPNKGTFFFTQLYDMGFEWYEAFFPSEPRQRVAGEVCEDYLSSTEALVRISHYRPDMRLICCLRNPYERALSHWRFFGRNGLNQPTLAEQGEYRPDLFHLGYYATQLQTVRALFPEEQVLIYLHDDLVASPGKIVRRLYEFVGADPDFIPRSLSRRFNAGASPRSKALARAVHRLHMHSWGRSRLGSNAMGTLKRFRLLRRIVTATLYRPTPVSDWADWIPQFPADVVSRYEQEITALEKMLGRDLASWRASAVVRRSYVR